MFHRDTASSRSPSKLERLKLGDHRTWRKIPIELSIILVRAYQVSLRPLLVGSCKFCPSCSEYAVIALQRHGLIRGGSMAFRRLLRCRPFRPGGIDPVPD